MNDRLKNVRKMSLVCLVYTFDTFFGLLYTFYFCYFWFSHEDTNPTGNEARDISGNTYDSTNPFDTSGSGLGATGKNLSQSASPARELFLTVSATLITTVGRFYFNLIIVSFTRLLIKQYSNESDGNLITEDEQEFLQSKTFVSKVKKFIFEQEIKSEQYLADFFSKN